MATNRIGDILEDIAAHFNEDALIDGTEEVFIRPISNISSGLIIIIKLMLIAIGPFPGLKYLKHRIRTVGVHMIEVLYNKKRPLLWPF